MTPPAPARLSTTTGWPIASWIFAATMRAVESVTPPGAKGTTIRTGFDGQICANALPQTKKSRNRILLIQGLSPCSCGLRNIVARHEIVDDAVDFVPRRFAVGVVAHDEGGAGVELLVLGVPAGELGADQVPGELEELHALHRATLRGLEVGVELVSELLVLDDRDVGG